MSQEFDSKAFYAKWARWLRPIVKVIYPFSVRGEENIPDRPCLVCANHSNFIDPILLALAFGGERQIHFMGKVELFRHPRFGAFLTKLGAFGVDRDGADISAVRTVMKYIRAGETVGIFPEGTRVDTDGAVEAKPGAVRMAAKLRVPIVPVYISRRKRPFHKAQVVIGCSFEVPAHTEDYQLVTNQMMDQIAQMGQGVQ